MSTTLTIIIAILAELLILIGAAAFFVRTIEQRTGKEIGILYVNPEEAEEGEGVYAQFYKSADPKAFTDGSSVILRVKVLRK